MSNKWVYIMCIALFGLFIIPRNHPSNKLEPVQKMSAQQEIQIKQQMVSADVRLTDELCRSQCSLDFHQTIKQLNNSSSQGQTDVLEKMIKAHPHMAKLIWANEGQEKSAGNLSQAVMDHVKNELQRAKQSKTGHKEYQSPPLIVNGETYFVLGVPSPTNKASLIGVMHQKILNQVAQHQVKNLRVVPYPADNHWKIESVDSKTLRDVKVDYPHENEGTSHYHKNEVVVKFRKQPTDSQLQQIKSEIKSKKMQKLGDTYVFQAETMDAKQLMAYFKKWNVVYTEPHFLYLTNENPTTIPSSGAEPNDSLYSKYQWNLPIIETNEGWSVGKGSQNVIVAVVDTGADLNHPDLQGRLQTGYNVIDPASSPMDDVGHGTHVAGIISALVNNGVGVAGMTWYNPVMPVKVLDETGAGNTYNVAQGIIWAADHGAKVINMSLGNYADANFLHDAIKYAYNKDIVLIAASGNDNTEEPGYPAAYPEVLAVAASDNAKKKATFSNFGDYIGVTAPGVNIPSTYPHNQYAALSGTSMASPHATALAALIRSTNPQLKNTEVMEIMRKTAEDLGTPGKDKYFGYGQIDVIRALQEAEGHTSNVAQLSRKPSSNFLGGWFTRQLEQIKAQFSS